MKKRKRARVATAPASESPESAPVKPAAQKDRGREIRRDFFKALLFIIVMVPLTVALEHSAIGEHAEQAAYDFLQSRLSSDDIPLAVVNISKLNPVEIEVNGKTRAVTPRAQLKQIVDAVIEKGARVIAIDVNFAPLGNGDLVDPSGDPDFFQFCLDKRNASPEGSGVPVILGIDWADNPEVDVRRPELLLDNPIYKGLFGWIRIPHQTNELAYKMEDDTGFELQTMSAAIAAAYQSSEEQSDRWLSRLPGWFAKQFSRQQLVPGVTADKFLVDYSALEALRSREYTLATADPTVIRDQGGFLKGKNVIIGDGTVGKAVDIFRVNGKVDSVPGIYLHSSAAYTLIKGRLYKLTWLGGLMIDSLMSLVILVSITGIRWYYKDRTPKEVARHRLERLFTISIGVLAILFGVWFVNYHRVMWLDFLLVVPLLLLNPFIERRLGDAWTFLRRKSPGALEAVVFEHDEEKHQ